MWERGGLGGGGGGGVNEKIEGLWTFLRRI